MIAKLQDGYKNNAMHVNRKHKWCMEKNNFGQKYRNWKFFSCDRSRIDRTSIESGILKPKILIAILIDRKTGSIDQNSGKKRFLKNKALLCRNSSRHGISWMKCMSMKLKVFQKHLNLTKTSKSKFFNKFVSKTQTLNTFCIKIKEHIILDGQKKFTHNIMYLI